MARSKKSNPTEEIANAINTVPDLDWGDVAEKLDITVVDLQERMASKLGDIVLSWELIPSEHFAHIDAIARNLEAERSTRKLEPQQAETSQLPEATEQRLEPPILEEKPEAKPKRQRRSSSLTKKKEQSIADTRQASTQANKGVADALTILQAQSGVQDGANAATAYLAGYTTNLTNVKGQGLTVIAAQTLQEISEKRNFDPSEVLQQIGIPLSSETLEALNETMGQVLGKSQAATTEITETAWGNGYDLQTELTALDKFMNSND
jgi:hypothetical protein